MTHTTESAPGIKMVARGGQLKDGRASDIRAVTRAVSVLNAFETAEELSLAELADRSGLPKPTVFRLALTLENAGLLSRSAEGHLFSLGSRLVSMARLVLDRGLPALARPKMTALARQFGHTVNLAVLDAGEMLFLDVIESRATLRMVAGIGAREPLHATAVGKAVASEFDPSQLEAIMNQRPMRAITPNTITSRAQLRAELRGIRERGYSLDRGEFQVGAHCVAAAIVGRHGVIGGLSISATADQLPEEDFPVVGEAIRAASDAVSDALGGHRASPRLKTPTP
jgi:IclR family acetate operon transcriptional repressor